MEKLVITDVKFDSNIAQITVNGVKDQPGSTLEVFRTISDAGIIVDMILSAEARDGLAKPIFTIDEKRADEAVELLMEQRDKLQFESIDCKKHIAKVTLTGSGLMSHSDIVPRVLSCFHESNASMDTISTSEIAIKVFTDESKAIRVVEKIRDEFVDYGL